MKNKAEIFMDVDDWRVKIFFAPFLQQNVDGGKE